MVAFKVLPEAPKVYTENFLIRSYHTDVNRKLTIPKLCSFFQEIAGDHTVACGVGWEVMQDQDVFWVLSRLKITINKYPVWQQKITIRTWSMGTNGLFAYRNFQVVDENGNELIKAISMWLMVNTATRRLVRPDDYMKDFPLCEDLLFEGEPEKIGACHNEIATPFINVSYSEIDMNNHMNNASYIERMIDSFEYEFLFKNEIAEIDINFNKEVRLGEPLGVAKTVVSEHEILNAVVFENGKDAVKMRSKWRLID